MANLKKPVSLEEDWDMLAAKEIKDPEAKKPEGWDDEPEYIADPDAEKPDDWDEEMDGEWEAPMIHNPEYKGPWIHPMIANPEYKEDKNLYSYDSWGAIGLDLWQVKSGTIFDNFLITDDIESAVVAAKADAEAAAAEAEAEEEDDDEEDLDEEDIDDDFEDD